MKLILTKGIQGSGKSTWARAFCEKNPMWVRVSRDDLRNMRGTYWLPKDEGMITAMEYACIYSALDQGKNCIVDSMNLNHEKALRRMIELKRRYPDMEWEYKDFTDVPLETCIKNDLKRPNSIGEKVIRATYNKYLRPEPPPQNAQLPWAIICDIDGTLALMTGKRSPYDWDRVGEDEVHKPVAEILRRFFNTHTIILLSGRDSVCRVETEAWLLQNNIPYHFMWMRPAGSMIKDVEVKRALYSEYIHGTYYVDFVMDDRFQVCRLWNMLGFNLLRVGDPDADF